MTEPTEKQIKFATSLGIENPASFGKKDLAKEIDKKLEEKNKGENTAPAPKTYEKPSKGQFEAHLSIEQVRTNAVDFALRSVGYPKDLAEIPAFWDLVRNFEKYLLNG